MASLNKVYLMGNLTADPDLRRTPSGAAVCSLRMAVNESFQNKAGEKVERTVFLDVDVWDRSAESVAQHAKKGSALVVEGRLATEEWADKATGQKRTRLKVRCERWQFVGGPSADATKANAEKPRPAVLEPEAGDGDVQF